MAVVLGAPCTVCAHPLVTEIDTDLLSPGLLSGYARAARTYGLQKDAVRRHKINGHVVKSAVVARKLGQRASGPSEPAPDSVTPLTAVESLQQTLNALNAVDTEGMSSRELNIHTDLKRKVAVDLAKYQVAVDREGPAQKELRVLEEMVLAMDDALEAFPDAKRAVAKATADWKARRGEEEVA